MFNKEYKEICYDSVDDSSSDDNEGFVGMDDEPLRVTSATSSVGFSADEHVQTDLVAASPTCSTPEHALKAPPTAETLQCSVYHRLIKWTLPPLILVLYCNLRCIRTYMAPQTQTGAPPRRVKLMRIMDLNLTA
jgi:hypothetical protein